MSVTFPLVVEIPYTDWPKGVPAFAALPWFMFFDSALEEPDLGRYSFLIADPFERWLLPSGASPELARETFRRVIEGTRLFRQGSRPDLPPFQGGAAGLWSYELNRAFEDVPAARSDDLQTPLLGVGLYDVVLAIDHKWRRAWLISQGFPETEPKKRLGRARERIGFFLEQLKRFDEDSLNVVEEKHTSTFRLMGQFATPATFATGCH